MRASDIWGVADCHLSSVSALKVCVEAPGQPHLNPSAGQQFVAKGCAEASADPLLTDTQLRRMPLAFDHRDALQSSPLFAMGHALQLRAGPAPPLFNTTVPRVGLLVIGVRYPAKVMRARRLKKSTILSCRPAWLPFIAST